MKRRNASGLPWLFIMLGTIVFWACVGEYVYGLTHRSTSHIVAK